MISRDDVKKIAKLARIEITENEVEKFQKDLSAILEYFSLLNEKDTVNIEPIFHPTEKFLQEKGEIMRKDAAAPCPEDEVSAILESAPDKKGRFLKVKAVL